MRQSTTAFLEILSLACLWAHGRCSPAAPPERQHEEDNQLYSGGPTTWRTRTAPGHSCTWTTTDLREPCKTWNSIETIYPSTSTSVAYVDCHGCTDVDVILPLWYCPNQRITATKVVTTPSTAWSTACAKTAAVTGKNAAPLVAPTAQVERRAPQGNLMDQNPAACPTTYVVQPAQTAGSTLTRYQQTATQTVRLPCGGCPLVLSTALAGYGPAGRFTTTITAPLVTTTTYVCQ